MAFSLEEYLKKIKDMQTPPPYQTPGYNPNLPTPGITPPGGGYPNSAPTMPQPNTKMDKLKELLQNPGIGNLIGALITKSTGGDPQGTIKYMDEQRQLGKENALKEKELKSRYDIAGMQEKGATDRQLRQFEQESKRANEEFNRDLTKIGLSAEQRAIELAEQQKFQKDLQEKNISADDARQLAADRRRERLELAKLAQDKELTAADIKARQQENAADRAFKTTEGEKDRAAYGYSTRGGSKGADAALVNDPILKELKIPVNPTVDDIKAAMTLYLTSNPGVEEERVQQIEDYLIRRFGLGEEPAEEGGQKKPDEDTGAVDAITGANPGKTTQGRSFSRATGELIEGLPSSGLGTAKSILGGIGAMGSQAAGELGGLARGSLGGSALPKSLDIAGKVAGEVAGKAQGAYGLAEEFQTKARERAGGAVEKYGGEVLQSAAFMVEKLVAAGKSWQDAVQSVSDKLKIELEDLSAYIIETLGPREKQSSSSVYGGRKKY